MRQAVKALFLSLTITTLSVSTYAADTYPSKPVRILVPFAPGGATDTLARKMAVYLQGKFGQSFVVENKPGGGTIIAAQELGRSKPDGYTIAIFEPSTATINPYLYNKPPYDPAKTLLPVTKLVDIPQGIVVDPNLPIRNFKEFVAYAKANPGTAFGTPGPTSPTLLGFMDFLERAGLDMKHVPYKGSAPAMADMMGGHLPVGVFDFSSTIHNIRAGKLRPIAVASLNKIEALPDMPTYAENGFPGYQSVAWFGLFTVAGTPRPVVDALNAAMQDLMADKEFSAWLKSQTYTLSSTKTPEQFEAIIQADQKVYSSIIKKFAISLD